MARWNDRTVAQVIARFQEAVNAFPPNGRSGETAVETAAYALQVSGARAGDRRMTRSTDVTVSAITR